MRSIRPFVAATALCGLGVLVSGCFENVPDGGFIPTLPDVAQPCVVLESSNATLAPEGGEFLLRLHVLAKDGTRIVGLGAGEFQIPSFFAEESGRTYDFSTQDVRNASPAFPDGPVSVAVVVDQSARVSSSDPSDRRIEAAKRLFGALGPGDEAVLFAFATGGQLPYPVTFWQGFMSTYDGFERTLDTFPDLEGGFGPLNDAIATALQYTGENASNANQWVVVLTAGTDAGSVNFQSVDRLLEYHDKEYPLPVFVAGVGKKAEPAGLSEIVYGTDGALLLARDPDMLPSGLSGFPSIAKGEVGAYLVRFTVGVEPPTLPWSGTLASNISVRISNAGDADDWLDAPFVLSW